MSNSELHDNDGKSATEALFEILTYDQACREMRIAQEKERQEGKANVPHALQVRRSGSGRHKFTGLT